MDEATEGPSDPVATRDDLLEETAQPSELIAV
jgi:hypothetical protein